MKSRNTKVTAFIAVAAAFIFLSTSFGCFSSESDRVILTAPDVTYAPASPVITGHQDITLPEMTYERPDIADMRAALEDLERGLKNGKPSEELITAYEQLRLQYDHADSMLSLVYLLYAFDVTDFYYRDEYSYLQSALSEIDGAMQAVSIELFQSSEEAAQLAAETFGEGYVDAVNSGQYSDDDSIQELLDREEQLALAYDNRIAVFSLLDNGRRWTYGDIVNDDSLDYDEYYRIYDAYCAALNKQVGPIFLEQLSLRAQIASRLGYDTYADYCYESYGRDYSPQDAKALHEAVKKYIVPLYVEACEQIDTYGLETTSFEEDAFFSALASAANSFSPMLAEPVAYMMKNRLYDVSESDMKMDTNFTTYISDYRAPYIFSHWTGSSDDIATILHELGHFSSYYHNSEAGYSASDNLDLAEMDAQALVLLLFEDYGSFYGEFAEEAEASVLLDAMYSLVSGCMEDEFQQAVYANPGMTLDSMNALYLRLAREYGVEEVYGYQGTEWVLISHTFQAPMYYISYAVSIVPALELFDLAQYDKSAAVTAYFNIMMREPYASLGDVLSQNGLTSVFSERTIANIAEIIREYL